MNEARQDSIVAELRVSAVAEMNAWDKSSASNWQVAIADHRPKRFECGCSVSGSPASTVRGSVDVMADPKWFDNANPACSVVPIQRFVNEHVFALKTAAPVACSHSMALTTKTHG
jgi:hypothetical protein